jgi:hypothetical protein
LNIILDEAKEMIVSVAKGKLFDIDIRRLRKNLENFGNQHPKDKPNACAHFETPFSK